VDPTENARRAARYRKDEALEAALAAFNARLLASVPAAAPGAEIAPFTGPVVFVVGPPRSGTTLLMQVLTRTRAFTFPDHIVARFPGDPAAGVLVSRSLRGPFTGLDPAHAAATPDAPARSEHGVTPGLFEPHEFGYFWSRLFDFSRGHAQDAAQLARADWRGLHAALAGMYAAGEDRPLLFKIVPLSMNADALAATLPGALFLTCDREPVDVALSMYKTRIARYGDAARWWSVQPHGHETMAGLPPVESVAAQLSAFLRATADALDRVPARRVFRLGHAELCEAPGATLETLDAFLTGHGLPPATALARPTWFAPPRVDPADAPLRSALADALARHGSPAHPARPADGENPA
jgi:hypothetical protein